MDTHLSWTVYLQTGRREASGEHHPLGTGVAPSPLTPGTDGNQSSLPGASGKGWELGL